MSNSPENENYVKQNEPQNSSEETAIGETSKVEPVNNSISKENTISSKENSLLEIPKPPATQNLENEQHSFSNTQVQNPDSFKSEASQMNSPVKSHLDNESTFAMGVSPESYSQTNPGSSFYSNPAGGVYAQTATKKETSNGTVGKVALIAALLAALSLGGGYAGSALYNSNNPTGSYGGSEITLNGVSDTSEPTESLAQVAQAVAPSVVSIEVATRQGTGSGSGVIINSNGNILTNNHVVSGGENGKITVKLHDGQTGEATILGTDEATDLAVISVKGLNDLKPAVFGSTDSLNVGDTVLALGSPLGLEGSVSSGIVSALDRVVSLGSNSTGAPSALVGDAIQTDAAINPGNSGGALVNLKGEVVGINTAIASLGNSFGGQVGSIGLGFAISSDEAVKIAASLEKGESPDRGVLGVMISDALDGGAKIESVSEGGAAANVLEVNDVILSVNSKTISNAQDLTAIIRSETPGEEITLNIIRDGNEQEVKVTLQSSKS